MNTEIKDLVELPLLDFFVALAEYDKQSLGRQAQTLDEYLPALTMLDRGYGLLSKEDLYDLCKTLWFKPYHSEKAFSEIFETYLGNLIQAILKKAAAAKKAQEEALTPNDKKETLDDKTGANEKTTPNEQSEEEPATEGNEEDEPEDEKVADEPKGEKHTTPEQRMHRVLFKYQLSETEEVAKETEISYQDIKQQIYKKNYVLRGKYFDLKSRLLQQSFQLIRDVVQEGRKDQIDWESTIAKIAKDGFFGEVVMKASEKIRSGLTILVDYEGSMVAFNDLTEMMVQSLQDYVGKKTQVFYFQNCPVDYVYEKKDRTKAKSLKQFIEGKPRTIIIVSDAGSARGHYNQERLQETKDFLKNMQKHRMVWLNPMPENRWKDTTADYIRNHITMYPMTQTGFVHAIKALKHTHRT